MECRDGAIDFQCLVNLVLKFSNGFIGKRDDKNLLGFDSLLLDQVLHFGGHRGSLSCSCAGHYQHIVLVCEDHLALLFIQRDCWIDFG